MRRKTSKIPFYRINWTKNRSKKMKKRKKNCLKNKRKRKKKKKKRESLIQKSKKRRKNNFLSLNGANLCLNSYKYAQLWVL